MSLPRIDKTKVKRSLTEAKFTPIQLVIIAFGVCLNLIMEKPMSEMVIAITQDVLILISGAKMSDLKGVIKDLKGVMLDPTTSLNQKLNQAMNLIITGAAIAGEIHDVMNKYPVDRFVQKIED